MRTFKRIAAFVLCACLLVAGASIFASCSKDDNQVITIGVYNSAGWETEQAKLWTAYENYLTKNLTNEDGSAMFKFVNSATTTMQDEINSFIAQGVDGIMLGNRAPDAGIESACATAQVPYVFISADVTASNVGTSYSDYCLGGMDAYYGDCKEFARQWLDYIVADMQAQGLTSAKISTFNFPRGMAPKHDEITQGMKDLIASESKYSGLSIVAEYYVSAVPLNDNAPATLTQMKADIQDSTKAAYGTNYVIGYANGMGTIVPTLSAEFGVAGTAFEKVKMLAIGYTPDTQSALNSYILTEAEVGVEGFASGLIRLYNQIKGVSYTDTASYKNSDGIVNVPTAWYIITGDNYTDFQTYVVGGGSYNFDTYKPNVTADEIRNLLGKDKLADIAAITNRTLAEIKAAHQ
jgi:ABC-type sugar transport system substrate-binding protein